METTPNLLEKPVSPQIISMIPEDLIRRFQMFPFDLTDNTLSVAMVNPSNLEAIDEIRLMTGCQIAPHPAAIEHIQSAIEKYLKVENRARQSLVDIRLQHVQAQEKRPVVEDDSETAEEPAVRLLNEVLAGAIFQHASDIHMEPQEPEMRIRYRIDGVLIDVMTIPKHIEAAIISRAKILCDMDITEKRRPQDGHYSYRFEGQVYDIRLACMPTVCGEKMVLRILDKARMTMGLLDLGFSQESATVLDRLVHKPYGMILITGPTGSGKTTTLYSLLNTLDKIKSNIVTIEDPVEYRLTGINQTQVNPQAGITFETGLKAFLRQDPNIILVGEVRDHPTAEIAVQAALTGHLVLSTLHTNDAASAVTRLIDMGIEPFLLSSTVIGVLAQRLARLICKSCNGSGCEFCHQTGMKGRTVVYELMEVTDRIRELIVNRSSADKIKAAMLEEGMNSFQQCGQTKIDQKLCTSEEIHRVVYY
ncbi:MAG: GspE/PulE family protein [Candidatus Margulisiibacteriota bacterium]